MHEQEFLGNRPRAEVTDPPKDWAQAAEQGQHELDEGARLAAHGDIRGALMASATGVGLLAEALQLQEDEDEQAERTAVMALQASGQLPSPVRADSVLPPAAMDYLAPAASGFTCSRYPTALELLDGPSCCDRHMALDAERRATAARVEGGAR